MALLKTVACAVTAAVVVTGGCSQQEPPTGYAVGQCLAIGGAMKDDNAELFRQMTARHNYGRVVVCAYATGSPQGADKRMAERLAKNGWKGTVDQLPDVTVAGVDRAKAAAMLAHADLIFFTGGDQSRITERFRAAPELGKALDEAMHHEGTPIAGTSAGAAMMSNPMFTGGGSESALAGTAADDGEKDDPPASGAAAPKKPLEKGVRIGEGLGFVRPITDTHFFQRGRVGRLVAGLEKSGVPFGIGIGENRAVAISNGSVCQAVGGDCAALLVDVRELKREGLSRLGSRVNLMSSGDQWSWPYQGQQGRGVVTKRPLGSGSVGIEAPGLNSTVPPEAWGKNVALDMLKRLAADPRTVQVAQSQGFDLVISADARTKFGWSADDPGALTIIDAKLDIVERKAVAPDSKPAK